jgi:L-ascorbate metabolism protein UlaG (beta-lactamase superfamily)
LEDSFGGELAAVSAHRTAQEGCSDASRVHIEHGPRLIPGSPGMLGTEHKARLRRLSRSAIARVDQQPLGQARRGRPPALGAAQRSTEHRRAPRFTVWCQMSTARHLASFARFLARREARERADTAALRELASRRLPLPPGLAIQWLGTAGYRLGYEGRTLLIDPYLTRVPLGAVFRREAVRADPALHARWLGADPGEVVGILVGHTHFDHAIDVPELARSLAAAVYGSSSLVHLMDLYGLAGQAHEVRPHQPYELGPFTVRFVPSLHSKLLLGYAVPFDGALSCEHLDHLSPAAYRCGPVYGIHIEVAGATLYHQGSANLIDDELPRGGVDVFLAGIAGRSFTADYWPRVLRGLQPSVVVASHFDDFFRPLSAPMGFSTNVNLAGLPDEIGAVSRDIAVATLPPPAG